MLQMRSNVAVFPKIVFLTVRVKAWCRSRCRLKLLALCVKSCLRCDSLTRNGGADLYVRLAVVPFALFSFCWQGQQLGGASYVF